MVKFYFEDIIPIFDYFPPPSNCFWFLSPNSTTKKTSFFKFILQCILILKMMHFKKHSPAIKQKKLSFLPFSFHNYLLPYLSPSYLSPSLPFSFLPISFPTFLLPYLSPSLHISFPTFFLPYLSPFLPISYPTFLLPYLSPTLTFSFPTFLLPYLSPSLPVFFSTYLFLSI